MKSEKSNTRKGWQTVKLGELCIQDREIVEPRSTAAQERPYLSLEHIFSGSGEIFKDGSLAVEDEGRSSTFAFDNRHVLYGKLRPYLNKVALPDFAGRCTTELIPLLPKPEIDREFLAWMLRRHETVAFAMQGKTGSRMPRADMNELLKMEVPFVPPDQQRRLAARLRQQMAEVGRARAAVQAQLETAHALPVALLRDVFNNSEEKAWSRKRISELRSSGVLIEHQDGNHGELHPRNKDFIAVGVKFVTAKHVQDDGRIALEQAPHISSIQANGLRIGFAQRCDVLLAHNATVGLVGQAPDNCEPFIVGTSLTIYRPEPKYLLPDFLFFALQSEEFQKQLFDAMKQTTRNQVPITRQRDLRLPLPPLMEQHRIATRLKSEFSAARSLVETLETRLAEIELLPAALLREAFNGKN